MENILLPIYVITPHGPQFSGGSTHICLAYPVNGTEVEGHNPRTFVTGEVLLLQNNAVAYSFGCAVGCGHVYYTSLYSH
jgi:hypothetical protein